MPYALYVHMAGKKHGKIPSPVVRLTRAESETWLDKQAFPKPYSAVSRSVESLLLYFFSPVGVFIHETRGKKRLCYNAAKAKYEEEKLKYATSVEQSTPFDAPLPQEDREQHNTIAGGTCIRAAPRSCRVTSVSSFGEKG